MKYSSKFFSTNGINRLVKFLSNYYNNCGQQLTEINLSYNTH